MDGTLLVGGTSVYISKDGSASQSPLQNAKKRAEAERDVRMAHGEKWSPEKHSEAINRHRNAYESRILGDFEPKINPGAAFHEGLGDTAARNIVRRKAARHALNTAALGASLVAAAPTAKKLARRRAAARSTNKLASAAPSIPTPAPVVDDVTEAVRRMPLRRYAVPAVATGVAALGAGALANQLRKDDIEPYRANQVWTYDRSADAFYDDDYLVDKSLRSRVVAADWREVGQGIGRNKGKIVAAGVGVPAAVVGARKFSRAMAARGVTRESQHLTAGHAADYAAEKLRRNPVGGRIGRTIDRQLARKPGYVEMQGKDALKSYAIAGGVGLGGGALLMNHRNKRQGGYY